MKNFFKDVLQNQLLNLYTLHIFNDGYEASFLLLLPFIAKDIHLNLTQVGFLGTLFNSLSILLALPAGYIATKVGGMRTLTIALFIDALGYLATGIAPNYFVLLLTFILAGIGFGLFHPIGFALIAKWSTKETRGRQMGNFTSIGDVGRVGISTVLTFIVVYIGWRYTTMIYAIIALVAALIFYLFFLSKSESIETKQKSVSKIRLKEIITHKRFLFAATANFLDTIASNALFIFLPFLLLKRGVNPAFLGSFAAAFFIGNFLGKRMLGRFVDKVGNAKVFIIADFLMALFIFFLANSTSFIIIIICSVILGIFTKGTVPVLQTMISESAEHHGDFEKTFAINEMLGSTAQTIAPVFLGFISDRFGIIFAFNIMTLFAIIAIIPAFAFHRYHTTK